VESAEGNETQGSDWQVKNLKWWEVKTLKWLASEEDKVVRREVKVIGKW